MDVGLRLGLIFMAAVTAISALFQIAPEFAAHKAFVQGAMEPYRDSGANLAQTAASVEGSYERLFVCDAALTDLVTLLQPKSDRARVAQNCLELADAVLAAAPTLSLAYVIKAAALRELGALAQVRAALILSDLTGGDNVQYAQRRAAMWIDQFAALNTAETAALRRDIVRLGMDAAGLNWIAGQYAGNVALRPVIAQALESLPEHQQEVFLTKVQRLAK